MKTSLFCKCAAGLMCPIHMTALEEPLVVAFIKPPKPHPWRTDLSKMTKLKLARKAARLRSQLERDKINADVRNVAAQRRYRTARGLPTNAILK